MTRKTTGDDDIQISDGHDMRNDDDIDILYNDDVNRGNNGSPDYSYGCIFCITGHESRAMRMLQELAPQAEFMVPQKKRRRRIKGKMHEETEILFSGYIFFRAERGEGLPALSRVPGVIRVLADKDGAWQLSGDDEAFAVWLFTQGETIGFSKAYYEGDRVRIVSGPLKNYEGYITKVNRRFQSGQITVRFAEREMKVWLGLDLVDKAKEAEEPEEQQGNN